MKKYFLSLVAIAAMLFATSCQESLVEPQLGGTTTFTVQVPDQMGTKALGSKANVNQLFVAVYADASADNAVAIYRDVVSISGGQATVSLDLVQGQKYDLVFWAQVDNNYVSSAKEDEAYQFELVNIPMNKNYHNTDAGAAFFYYWDDFKPTGTSQPVTLRRPFAQLNLGTTEGSLTNNAGTFTLKSSVIKVKGIADNFNTVSGFGTVAEANKEKVYTFIAVENSTVSTSLPLDATIKVADVDYKYVSMDYLPIIGDDKSLVTVKAEITLDNSQFISHEFTNVPVRENYRTNIVGNLISSSTDFVVTIEEGFVDENRNQNPDNDYLVVDNVKAANDVLKDGEAYVAINMIEKDAPAINIDENNIETLYLQLPDADAQVTISGDKAKTIYVSVPNTNPNNDGLTLSINTPNAHVVLNGQVYDVPFSSTSSSTLVLDGVMITKSVTVEQGNVVVGEGTEIGGNDEGNQIISDEAIVIINGTEEAIRVKGDNVVVVEGTQDEINVSNVSELRAAVNTIDAGGVINITNDIADVKEVIFINKNITINGVTINGVNKSISGNASRIFRICSSQLNVEMNDLNIVSTAVRNGTNDIRGISLDADLKNVTLTLNNCSVDFTHDSASDYSYGVNFTGGTTNTLIINGGVYEGANAINLRGDEHKISIEEAKLTSIYSYNDMYFGQCIRLDGTGSVVNVKNTIFNGDHAVAIGGKSENEITVEGNTDNTKYAKVKAGEEYCYSLEEAIGSIESEGVIKLLFSFESDPVTIPNGKTITLNLNDKTVTAVDNSTGSYGLITNHAKLTIKGPGTISLSATNNRGWNAYSSVISNQPGGNLTVGEGVVIEHLGGTDMAYGIDNLTNGKGTSAITTINDAIVKSTYRAVRQFLNGVEANNSLTVNSGAVIEGANKSIWMQDPSANLNTGTLDVNEGAILNGDVYLYVCAGSTEWPVSVSIAASTVKGEVLTGNVPAGYEVVCENGVWFVRKYTTVSTADELVAALEAKENVLFLNDIKIEPASMSNAYGATGINVKYGQTINGNGYTLNIKGAGGTWDSGINTTGGLIKNITVTGSFRGIFINHTSDYSEKVVLENVTIGGNGTVYTISCDQGLYQGIEATNCTFNGWTSFAETAGKAKFVNCNFGEGSGYKYCRPYSNTEFVNCTFCPGYAVDRSEAEVTFTNCTWEE